MSKARAKLNAILGSDDDDDDEGDAVEDHAPAAALETQASQMKPAKHADRPEKLKKKKKKKESAAKQEAARAQELTSATQSLLRAEAEHEGLGAGFTPHIAPFDGVLAKLNRRRQQLTGRPFQPPPPTMPPVATADDILENLDAVMAAALAAGGGGSSGDEGRGGDGSGDDARLLIEDDASEDEAGPSSGECDAANTATPAEDDARRDCALPGASASEADLPCAAAEERAGGGEHSAGSQGAALAAGAVADAASQRGLSGRRAEGQQRRKDAFATMIKAQLGVAMASRPRMFRHGATQSQHGAQADASAAAPQAHPDSAGGVSTAQPAPMSDAQERPFRDIEGAGCFGEALAEAGPEVAAITVAPAAHTADAAAVAAEARGSATAAPPCVGAEAGRCTGDESNAASARALSEGNAQASSPVAAALASACMHAVPLAGTPSPGCHPAARASVEPPPAAAAETAAARASMEPPGAAAAEAAAVADENLHEDAEQVAEAAAVALDAAACAEAAQSQEKDAAPVSQAARTAGALVDAATTSVAASAARSLDDEDEEMQGNSDEGDEGNDGSAEDADDTDDDASGEMQGDDAAALDDAGAALEDDEAEDAEAALEDADAALEEEGAEDEEAALERAVAAQRSSKRGAFHVARFYEAEAAQSDDGAASSDEDDGGDEYEALPPAELAAMAAELAERGEGRAELADAHAAWVAAQDDAALARLRRCVKYGFDKGRTRVGQDDQDDEDEAGALERRRRAAEEAGLGGTMAAAEYETADVSAVMQSRLRRRLAAVDAAAAVADAAAADARRRGAAGVAKEAFAAALTCTEVALPDIAGGDDSGDEGATADPQNDLFAGLAEAARAGAKFVVRPAAPAAAAATARTDSQLSRGLLSSSLDMSRSQSSDAPGLLGRTFSRGGPQMRAAASAAATATFVLNDGAGGPGSRPGARKPLAASQVENTAARRGDPATFAGLKELLGPAVDTGGASQGAAACIAASGAAVGVGAGTAGEVTAMKRHLQAAAAFGRVAKRRP